MTEKTIRRRKAKAQRPGCCSNAWCHQTPDPPFRVCYGCRVKRRQWDRKHPERKH